MLKDEIQRRVREALKSGNTVEKEVLRVALGEIQTAEAREGAKAATDEAAQAVVRKLMKSVGETLSLTEDAAARATLEAELAVLGSLLPKSLSADEVVAALAGVADAVRAAPNDGAATGVAMRALKASKAEVNGKDVAEAVRRLRQGG